MKITGQKKKKAFFTLTYCVCSGWQTSVNPNLHLSYMQSFGIASRFYVVLC